MPANIAETLYAEVTAALPNNGNSWKRRKPIPGARLEKLRKRGGGSENVGYRTEMETSRTRAAKCPGKLQQLTRLTTLDAGRGETLSFCLVKFECNVSPGFDCPSCGVVLCVRRWKRCRLPEKKKWKKP